MLFKVFLLVCSLNAPCSINPNEHIAILEQPIGSEQPKNELQCGLFAQSYMASSALKPDFSAGEYLKIVCMREK
jgi:hypothetical protein